jgi:hypothetical protein
MEAGPGPALQALRRMHGRGSMNRSLTMNTGIYRI